MVGADRYRGFKDVAGGPPVGVAVLGSTGSIGVSALQVLERQRDYFRVDALTSYRNAELLEDQVSRFSPEYVGLVSPAGSGVMEHWHSGAECLVEAAARSESAIVINAVVGSAGLPATLAALEAGKRVALANKESLVMAGSIVMETASRFGGEVVPVDSEHSAILQCLAGREIGEVRRIVLTASGGPFRTWSEEQIAGARVQDALCHPTWQMGAKITVDSASLANKALEVIEAHHLFGISYDRIDVVVHPQSIVHSFVEFVDGSVLAQLGVPSMELPILFALGWPERIPDAGVPPLDLALMGSLNFEPVRYEQFPMLHLGIGAGRKGGAAPAVYNAANEAAVAHFLDGRLSFPEIAVSVAKALDSLGDMPGDSLKALEEVDALARDFVNVLVRS